MLNCLEKNPFLASKRFCLSNKTASFFFGGFCCRHSIINHFFISGFSIEQNIILAFFFNLSGWIWLAVSYMRIKWCRLLLFWRTLQNCTAKSVSSSLGGIYKSDCVQYWKFISGSAEGHVALYKHDSLEKKRNSNTKSTIIERLSCCVAWSILLTAQHCLYL